MNPNLTIAILGFTVAALCPTPIASAAEPKASRIRSDLVAKQFNSVNSQYADRPTFVDLSYAGSSKEVLSVHIYPFKGDSLHLMFPKKNVADYLKAIGKYFEWAKLAGERQDAFTKGIAVIPSVQGVSLNFTFHSGNEHTHFLTINLRSSGPFKTDLPDSVQVYDETNAKKLRDLLELFAQGKLRPATDIDSIYK